MSLYLVWWIKMIIPLLFQTPQPLPPSVSQISVTPENFLEEAPANIFGCPRTKKKVKPRTENVMMSDQSVQKTLFHSPLTPRCVILVQLENLIFALYWNEEQIQCLRWWTCLILYFVSDFVVLVFYQSLPQQINHGLVCPFLLHPLQSTARQTFRLQKRWFLNSIFTLLLKYMKKIDEIQKICLSHYDVHI